MASGSRGAIRAAVIAALTGATSAGDRVYARRAGPHDDLPSLNVDVSEANEADAMDPDAIDRTFMVTVEARQKASLALDDELDALCLEVEVAVMGASGIAAVCSDLVYEGTSFDTSDDAEIPAGIAALRFQAVVEED